MKISFTIIYGIIIGENLSEHWGSIHFFPFKRPMHYSHSRNNDRKKIISEKNHTHLVGLYNDLNIILTARFYTTDTFMI